MSDEEKSVLAELAKRVDQNHREVMDVLQGDADDILQKPGILNRLFAVEAKVRTIIGVAVFVGGPILVCILGLLFKTLTA